MLCQFRNGKTALEMTCWPRSYSTKYHYSLISPCEEAEKHLEYMLFYFCQDIATNIGGELVSVEGGPQVYSPLGWMSTIWDHTEVTGINIIQWWTLPWLRTGSRLRQSSDSALYSLVWIDLRSTSCFRDLGNWCLYFYRKDFFSFLYCPDFSYIC